METQRAAAPVATGQGAQAQRRRLSTIGESTEFPWRCSEQHGSVPPARGRRRGGGGDPIKAVEKGVVGINVYSFWIYPLTNSTVDLEATKRYQDFVFGWTVGLLVFGDYPQAMKTNVGSRLPWFTKSQSEFVKGAIGFIGINHYYSVYVNDRPLKQGVRDYAADMSVYQRGSRTDPSTSEYVPTAYPDDPEGL